MTDVRRAFRLLPRGLRWRWLGLLPLILLGAIVEAVSAGVIFGLLRLLTAPELAPLPGQAGRLLQRVAELGGVSPVFVFTLVAMALYVVRFGVLSLSTYARDRVVYASVEVLAERTLQSYLTGPLPSQRDTAAMLQRIEQSPEIVASLGFASVINLVAEVLVVVALLTLLGLTAPVTTLVAIVLTAVGLLFPAALTRGVFHRWGEREALHQEQLHRELGQGLGALREIRVYGRERFFAGRFARVRDLLSTVQRRRALLSDILRLGVETVFVLVLLGVLAIVTLSGSPAGVVSLLGLYAYAGFRLVPSANRITLNLNSLRGAGPFARAVADDAERAPADVTTDVTTGDPASVVFARDLTLSNVSYRYGSDAEPALSDISLTIRRGESIGIVGPSGAGKSTLLDLILGLAVPTAGSIRVDGRDIHSDLAAWRRQIGYVAQSFYLLDDTIAQNIAFGLKSGQIDAQRVAAAIRTARLESLISSLPDGLNTPLGERGTRLSGGERQRVAIARALYNSPAVLLFDEATAALDPRTEREVSAAIASLRGERTIVVIAHGVNIVQNCDRLVMLQAGRVVDVGSFDELMARSESFRALVAADSPSTPEPQA